MCEEIPIFVSNTIHIMPSTLKKDNTHTGPVFRKATEADIAPAGAILRQAVDRMLAEGKQQWDHSYPNETHIRADIDRGIAYVLELDGEVVAYGAVVFDGEPAYDIIDGKWLTDGAYVVVHRLATLMSSQRTGLAMTYLRAVEHLAHSQGIRSFRVDTNFDNIRMLNLLAKAGFTCCGQVLYPRGPRKAFEKVLE